MQPCLSSVQLLTPIYLSLVPSLSYSISVLQWLFNSDSSSHNPGQRLLRFFTTLHSSLKRPSRAVLQFYPESDDQVHLALSTAMRAGFGGGLVIDYPNSRKAKKFFLCLMVGGGGGGTSNKAAQDQIPKGLEMDDGKVRNEVKREKVQRRRKGKKVEEKGGKDWILRKKELYRKRGKEDVPRDSKFTARKRKTRF